jgi:hypothetical protein
MSDRATLLTEFADNVTQAIDASDCRDLINSTLLFTQDTAANFTANNPVLEAGVCGVETDTLQFKLGNGSTTWNELTYQPATKQVVRRDTSTNWAATNPIPAANELCIETNTYSSKVGDGSTHYNSLPYFLSGNAVPYGTFGPLSGFNYVGLEAQLCNQATGHVIDTWGSGIDQQVVFNDIALGQLWAFGPNFSAGSGNLFGVYCSSGIGQPFAIVYTTGNVLVGNGVTDDTIHQLQVGGGAFVSGQINATGLPHSGTDGVEPGGLSIGDMWIDTGTTAQTMSGGTSGVLCIKVA